MDRNYGGGFRYTTTNEEIFDYGSQLNSNYPLMNHPEILAVTPQDYDRNDYPSNNRQQMQQMYYSDVQYGNDGCHSPRHSSNYHYAPEVVSFDYNQQNEYPSHQMSVRIRLSGRGFIDQRLIYGLQQQNFTCEYTVRGSVITVSGYPADDGANGILALVRQISGDRQASIE